MLDCPGATKCVREHDNLRDRTSGSADGWTITAERREDSDGSCLLALLGREVAETEVDLGGCWQVPLHE